MENKELFNTIEKIVDNVREFRALPEWERQGDEEYIISDALDDIIECIDEYFHGNLSRRWELDVY